MGVKRGRVSQVPARGVVSDIFGMTEAGRWAMGVGGEKGTVDMLSGCRLGARGVSWWLSSDIATLLIIAARTSWMVPRRTG